MSETVIPVSEEWMKRAHIGPDQYESSIAGRSTIPTASGRKGRKLQWIKPFTRVKDTSYALHDLHIRWFEDGALNVAANCIDRHWQRAATRPRSSGKATIRRTARASAIAELHREVCRFANVLKASGVKKGDRVTIYLPMIPEAAYAMLACARIGAVHSVVFARLLAGQPRRPHPGLRLRHRHHRR